MMGSAFSVFTDGLVERKGVIGGLSVVMLCYAMSPFSVH